MVGVCRFCRANGGRIVLDLGSQPSSELFPAIGDPGPDPTFPLRMWLCADCGLAQLADDADVPEEPLGQEPAALRAQRRDAVAHLAGSGALPARGSVAEFPSPHGGTWVDLLGEHGLTPAPPGEPADVVVDGCFGIMHERDQFTALTQRARAVREGGVLLLQYHALDAIVSGIQWNALRLGHYAYYSTPAMSRMLTGVGLYLTSATRFPLYGGTVLVTAGRADAPRGTPPRGTPPRETLPPRSIAEHDRELAAGVLVPEVVGGLQSAVARTAGELRETLRAHRAAGRRVYGYSAASRAVALLCLAGVDATLLAGVADAAAAKQGRRMPGTDIPIISPDRLVAARPDVVLLFVPDLLDEVRATLPGIEAAGGRWIC